MGGLSEKDLCIKCDGGGEILVCSNSSCPIAVHAKCLGFPAKFDRKGEFYCPYCVYKLLVQESHEARERALSRKKALSLFLDTKCLNGDFLRQGSGTWNQKEPTHLFDAGKTNGAHSENDESRRDKVNVPKQFVSEKEDQEGDRFAPAHSKQVLVSKEADVLFVGNQNDGLSSKNGDTTRVSGLNHHVVAGGHSTASGPVVTCGNNCVDCDDVETKKRFEIAETGNRIQTDCQQLNDDHQPQRSVENRIDDIHFVDPLIIEKQRREDGTSSFLGKKGGNNASTALERVGKTAAFSHREPAVPLLEKRGFETSDWKGRDSNIAENMKRVKNNDNQPTDANRSRMSRDSASAVRVFTDHIEKINACSSTARQLTEPATTKNLLWKEKRKTLRWRDEEVDMLKKGFEEFSDMNKNVPWSKILEFGRHVFDGTRTPGDLRDKWRNLHGRKR